MYGSATANFVAPLLTAHIGVGRSGMCPTGLGRDRLSAQIRLGTSVGLEMFGKFVLKSEFIKQKAFASNVKCFRITPICFDKS